MKTRTLLLLALACGVAIMLAGAVLLVQLSSQDDVDPPVPVGEMATVGDMTVVVERTDEAGGLLDVTVRIGGVDDDDGADGFRLIASGRAVEPVEPVEPGAETGSDAGVDARCGATTVAELTCILRFDVSAADGVSRVLFFERGDDSVRWVLG